MFVCTKLFLLNMIVAVNLADHQSIKVSGCTCTVHQAEVKVRPNTEAVQFDGCSCKRPRRSGVTFFF